jgi:FkbM family methyltransferase
MLVLPYTRRGPPAWGRLLALAGVESRRLDSSTWTQAPTVTLRGKTHGFLMRLDLSNGAERRTFFIGRHDELHLQRLLAELLRAGDRMLDVGANVGMITLCASRLVGSSGRVESFEPDPDCVRWLEDNPRLNDIRNVVIHRMALAEPPSRMTLRLQTSRAARSRHWGTGTLAPVAEPADDVIVGAYRVDVARGDDIVGADRRHAVSAIRLDVEGFELNALKGLRETRPSGGRPSSRSTWTSTSPERARAAANCVRGWRGSATRRSRVARGPAACAMCSWSRRSHGLSARASTSTTCCGSSRGARSTAGSRP